MSLHGRISLALVAVIATVLAVLAVLSILQHDAIYSQLVRQRLAVTVESTARPFRSVVELGLPVSMMRNRRELLLRAQQTDLAIAGVALFNPTGIVVETTGALGISEVPRDVLLAQSRSTDGRWSLETGAELISGASIFSDDGKVVGGIFAVYPMHELEGRAHAVRGRIARAAAALLILFGALAYLVTRPRLAPLVQDLRRIERNLSGEGDAPRPHDGVEEGTPLPTRMPATLAAALNSLDAGIAAASAKYRAAITRLDGASAAGNPAQTPGPTETVLVGVPETALTRRLARRLTPAVAVLAIGSAVALGYVAYQSVSDSFRPEIARRAQLIGSEAAATVQRTLEAGVPIDNLVGGSEYLEHLLADFPDVSYLAVIAEGSVLEVGTPAARRQAARKGFPIVVDDQQVGEVVTETDPNYVAARFRDVVLDLAVVLLVAVLFAFELIVIMMTRSVTGPLERLQHLVGLQAAGDFSRRLSASGGNVIERLGAVLSERAERLNTLVAMTRRAAAVRGGGAGGSPLGPGFHVSGRRPALLRFCSLTDVRLPMFLFAMADELPLSFFSLYARAAENPFASLNHSFVIGLPLAAYLAAALLSAPLARPIGRWVGYRTTFLGAAALTFAAKLGLVFATGIVEIIVWHGLNGVGFAFAALACQDYVLDMLPHKARSRSMGLFRATLFSGVFAGTALGGILADRLGQRPVFAVCAVLAVLAAALICRALPAGRMAPAIGSGETAEPLSFAILAPLRNPRFAAVALGIVVPQAIIDHVFISYLLALQMDALGASVSDIARVMMCFFLMLILAGSAQGMLPERHASPVLLLAASSSLAGAVLLGAAVMPAGWSTLLAASGAGLALGLSGGPQAALVMDAAEGPLAHLGTNAVLGAMRVLERGGAIAGLLIIGWLTDRTGYSGAAGIIGLAALAGAGGFVLVSAAVGRTPISGRNA